MLRLAIRTNLDALPEAAENALMHRLIIMHLEAC
jgi:hypothetical protein